MLSKQPVGKVDCFGPFLLTLTDPFFKTGIYVAPSKLHNPTILCQEGGARGPFVNYVCILGCLVGQKRAIFAYF